MVYLRINNMEEIVFIKQSSDKWDTTIKCDKSVKRIEVVFNEKDCRVKSVVVERKEDSE